MDRKMLKFDAHEDDWWIYTATPSAPNSTPFELTLTSVDEPDVDYLQTANKLVSGVDVLCLKAATLIVQNYSCDRFKACFEELGLDYSVLLKDETPEGMQKVAQLEAVTICDSACRNFEMSFALPWDLEHSFDVQFQDGEPTHCAVNG
jgi:hypothetical protein